MIGSRLAILSIALAVVMLPASAPAQDWLGSLPWSGSVDVEIPPDGLPPGPATLRIEAAGFARTQLGVAVPGEEEAELGDVPLSAGTTLAVSVGPKGEGIVVFVDPGAEGLPFDRLMAPAVAGLARVEQVPVGAARVSVTRGAAILCEKPEHSLCCCARVQHVERRIIFLAKQLPRPTVIRTQSSGSLRSEYRGASVGSLRFTS